MASSWHFLWASALSSHLEQRLQRGQVLASSRQVHVMGQCYGVIKKQWTRRVCKVHLHSSASDISVLGARDTHSYWEGRGENPWTEVDWSVHQLLTSFINPGTQFMMVACLHTMGAPTSAFPWLNICPCSSNSHTWQKTENGAEKAIRKRTPQILLGEHPLRPISAVSGSYLGTELFLWWPALWVRFQKTTRQTWSWTSRIGLLRGPST